MRFLIAAILVVLFYTGYGPSSAKNYSVLVVISTKLMACVNFVKSK